MARRAAFDVTAGRQYLAGLPEFQPTKPLGDYKPATIKRYVTQFQAQRRAGTPISRQAARGHVVTPEHGPRGARPKLPATPSEYRGGKLPKSKYLRRTQPLELPRIHKRPINVPERANLSDGSVVDVYYDVAPLLHRLRDVGSDRVILSGFDCDLGVYRHIGINRGHTQGWTADGVTGTDSDRLALLPTWVASGMDFEDWFISLANSTDSDPEQSHESIRHVCIWTLHTYPVNAHLRRSAFRR